MKKCVFTLTALIFLYLYCSRVLTVIFMPLPINLVVRVLVECLDKD